MINTNCVATTSTLRVSLLPKAKSSPLSLALNTNVSPSAVALYPNPSVVSIPPSIHCVDCPIKSPAPTSTETVTLSPKSTSRLPRLSCASKIGWTVKTCPLTISPYGASAPGPRVKTTCLARTSMITESVETTRSPLPSKSVRMCPASADSTNPYL